MFKYIHKITSYQDELRYDLKLNKRIRNYRFKNKVLYIIDRTIFCKKIDRLYYKFPSNKYVVNDALYYLTKLKNNILHRNFDKPAIIYPSGTQIWFYHGEKHRKGKPAYIGEYGYQEWYYHGKRHRDNGEPAIICSDGTKYWYKNGVKYTP